MPLRSLPPRLGISPSMMFAYRAGKNQISNKAWGKLRSAEIGAGLLPPERAVESTDYRNVGSREAVSPDQARESSDAVLLDPRFQPRASPSTRADVETYFRSLCDAADASGDPNAFPAIMRALQRHLPITDFVPRPEP